MTTETGMTYTTRLRERPSGIREYVVERHGIGICWCDTRADADFLMYVLNHTSPETLHDAAEFAVKEYENAG